MTCRVRDADRETCIVCYGDVDWRRYTFARTRTLFVRDERAKVYTDQSSSSMSDALLTNFIEMHREVI